MVEFRFGSSWVESGFGSPVSVSKESMEFLPSPEDPPSMIHRMNLRFLMMILPWMTRLFQRLTRRRMTPGTLAILPAPAPTRTPLVP